MTKNEREFGRKGATNMNIAYVDDCRETILGRPMWSVKGDEACRESRLKAPAVTAPPPSFVSYLFRAGVL